MKNIFIKIKWMVSQAKPIVPYLLLIVIIGSIISFCAIYRALIMKQLIDAAVASQKNVMVRYVIFLIILILSDVIFEGINSIISTRCSNELTNSIQKKIYTRLTETAWLEFSKYHTEDIITRLTSDVGTLTDVIVNTIPGIISLLVLLLGSFITLLSISPLIASAALLITPIIIILSRIYGSKIKTLYIKGQELEAKYRSFLNETFENIVIIKAFNLESRSISQVDLIQKNRQRTAMSNNKVSVFSNSLFSFGSWLGVIIVLTWGGFNIANRIITFGTLSALLSLFGNIQYPLSSLASSLPKLISAVASAERLMLLDKIKTDLYTPEIGNLSSAGIKFDDVSFSYNKLNIILEDISFELKSGEIAALVGPSGEGKTTLIRLLLSLIHYDKGRTYITSDSAEYEISASTRKYISYVPQGNTLFSGTIEDNLRQGYPDATEDEIKTAAELACSWEFINSLPAGINTIIGEHGIGLSEGQAQRIAIARALLRKSPILILDEATSALDPNTEVHILKNIKKLSYAPTCIIITHRIAALGICNRVFRLEKCNLIEIFDNESNDAAIEAI